MPELRPYGPRVLLGDMGSVESVRDSGIVIPATVAERKGLTKGFVVAVGFDVREIEPEMTVYFREHSAYDIGGQTVIDAKDIIAFDAPDE